ncbi:leucine-rich repeat and WD repeat-containing protein 1-like [Schistocerca cancellata]|uniref:leucine-rich repeat and WD repeat-containing protein 1-like n=1 Tax=Schistocerca cancellata TaxID=274614 RepID=UPI002118E84D|nr:leucine-rich repeat and WD repeat-containing protein 1-like [Schistocerca cancellata]
MKRAQIRGLESEVLDCNGDAREKADVLTGPCFEPSVFFRCHSWRKAGLADVRTQVWHCAFESDVRHPEQTTDVIATCGGNSICFIDVNSGFVKSKYYAEDPREIFYTLSWSWIAPECSGSGKISIVAAGGTRCIIHLLHPQNGALFYTHRLKCPSSVAITSLLFHKEHREILFGAKSDGTILVWDIGYPVPPKYAVKFTTLHQLSSKHEVFQLAYCLETKSLLVSCADGVCVWSGDVRDTSLQEKELKMPPMPGSINANSPQLVDSIEVLGCGRIAAKCALHGAIYIWSLAEALKSCKSRRIVKILPAYTLKWSNTDNYFMNMGFSKGSGVLACGDDEGRLWLYDTKNLFDNSEITNHSEVNPVCVLQWPDVVDNNVIKRHKCNLDSYDTTVINKVAINYAGNCMVGVTSNNLVCIWKRK